MKLPDYFNRESSHIVSAMNTISMVGISLLWGVMLDLIPLGWIALSILCCLSGYGSEIEKRKGEEMIDV